MKKMFVTASILLALGSSMAVAAPIVLNDGEFEYTLNELTTYEGNQVFQCDAQVPGGASQDCVVFYDAASGTVTIKGFKNADFVSWSQEGIYSGEDCFDQYWITTSGNYGSVSTCFGPMADKKSKGSARQQ